MGPHVLPTQRHVLSRTATNHPHARANQGKLINFGFTTTTALSG
jgi:hypothetical protein